jgi:hypothetical protein
MTKTNTAPAAFSEEEYVAIPMTPVTSNQVAAVGYSPERKTLAISFSRTGGAVYHYPNVDAKTHADFVGAESIGKYFGQHIKTLPFKKFKAPEAA